MKRNFQLFIPIILIGASLFIFHVSPAAAINVPLCPPGTIGEFPACVPMPCPPNTIGVFPACLPIVQQGSLTIIKNSIGGDGSFNFTVSNDGESVVNSNIRTTEGSGLTQPIPLNAGTYIVQEASQEGWTLTNVSCIYDGESVGSRIENGELITLDAGDEVTCTFINTRSESMSPENNRSLCSDAIDNDLDELVDARDPDCGPSLGIGPNQGGAGGNDTTGGGGQVLGASTESGTAGGGEETLGGTCNPYLNSYIGAGLNNNPIEVIKLQTFLNTYAGASVPVNGIYGPLTQEAVNAFQVAHAADVLDPWVSLGLTTEQHAHGTGFVGPTTIAQMTWIAYGCDIPLPTSFDH